MSFSYSRRDINSILEYASKLKGKSLRQVCGEDVINNGYTGKGNFGQILEKYYFEYNPNSVSEPDFNEVGIELKSSPLKKSKKNHLSAKERLVLSIINYNEIIDQDFETSSFLIKNNHLLLILYLHESGVDVIDFVIKLVGDWKIPDDDLAIIKSDWEKIQNKVREGRAHELSEGDTLYLGACTKGGKGGNPRQQPRSVILAKQRAFSLKQGYLNHVIGKLSHKNGANFGKIIEKPILDLNFEELVISKFEKFYNKSTCDIEENLGIQLNNKAKSYFASLSKKILGVDIKAEIEEFEKADIIIKSVRLNENELPKESISFPNFKFEEIVNEEWEDSSFKDVLEHKFLFVFYQLNEKKLILKKAKFWNMPFSDIEIAKQVWGKTREIVSNGNIVKEILENGTRKTNFPNNNFNSIAHVRPHAQNAEDTFPLPVIDKISGLNRFTKQCFWLNKTYIRDEIYNN
jgi:DNA mismatch repair protein MutH